MSDKTYNILKWTASTVLPATALFYGTIGKIWGLPFTEEIPLTIVAVETLLGTMIGIQSISYNSQQ